MPALPRVLCSALCCVLAACAASDRGAADADAAPTARVASDTDAPTPSPAPQAEPTISFASWAARLVDNPLARSGDRDAVVADWIALLREEPGHPLAEGTLALLGAVEPDLERPQDLRAALLALDAAAGFDPLAAGRLRQLQARARSRGEPASALPEQLFAEHADAALVLGPLPPADDPLALTEPVALLTKPDFNAAVPGVDGAPLGWRPLLRSGELGRLQLSSALPETNGWLVLALEAELPGGGAGFVELDLGGSAGASSAGGADQLFAFGGSDFRGFVHGANTPPPSFAWSLNGASPGVIDMGAGERSGRVLLPVVFRDGGNRVMWRMLGSGLEHFSVRMLDASGASWPGARWVLPGGALGTPVKGSPPLIEPRDSVAALFARETRGELEDALLGVLLLLDRRPAAGLHHLSRAAGGEHLGPKALLASVLDRLAYLPLSVRRSRVRQVVDAILEVDADYFPAAVSQVEQWLAEDREIDALERLRELVEQHPGSARGLLRLHAMLEQLRMPADAERVLERAREAQPESPAVLERLAETARRHGARTEALQLEQRALELSGRTAGGLEQLALRFTGEGRLDEAERHWREALERLPSRTRRLRFARWLSAMERPDEARELLQDLAAEDPRDLDVLVALADLELLVGDERAERDALDAALDVAPGYRALRTRRAGGPLAETVRAEAERWLVPTADALRDFDDAAHGDSVVKVLDQAYVHVFRDGVVDTITHDLLQPRDLEAVNALGERQPSGEVLALATVKPDGRRFEPVLVNRSYVMPNLKPRDFIEQVTRDSFRVPPGRAIRPGGWFFQSTRMPFLRSRYVVSLPRDHGLRLVLERFEGTHEVIPDGDREVHVFEVLDSPRLQPERGAPPEPWVLPRVEFGQDDDLQAEHHRQLVLLRAATEPTPEIFEKVHELTRLLPGEELRARALFAWVQDHVQQRWSEVSPASAALLTGEGNPTILFASMLRAAGIDHELIWTRDVPPAADPEPVPDFLTAGRLTRKLLVSVVPDDGAEVFCDLAQRSQPYGQLLGDAPGAEAMVLGSGRFLPLPASDPESTPGQRIELSMTLAADGSAEVRGRLGVLGPGGFAGKAQFREAPDSFVRANIGAIASAVVPDLDLGEAWVEGLDAPGERLALAFTGRVPRFLDSAGGASERPLPMPPWQLTARVSSEGARRLPFRSVELSRAEFLVELDLGEDFELAEALPQLDEAVAGLSYRFEVDTSAPGVLRMERVLAWEPFVISAEEHADLVRLAARVDELERGRLRLRRR